MPEQTPDSTAGQRAVPARGTQTFPRRRRLLTAADFNRVFEQASVRAGTGELFALARPVATEQPTMAQARIGFIVSRKNVRKAVNRNLLKRIAREEFRRLDPDYPAIDIIVMARRGAGTLSREALHDATRYLLRKLRQRYAEQQAR